jgi:hypothetical protein
MEEKNYSVSEKNSHCFHYENYAQITSKQFHLLFVHDDNKSNNGQIGQIVVIDDSEKTQDFFLCSKLKNRFTTHLDLVVCIMHIFFIHWKTFHLLL